MAKDTKLLEVINEQLSAVSFIHDYIELVFYEKIIRVFTASFLKNTEGEYKYPQAGSRDALCSLIGKTVVSINILGGERVELYFSGGEALAIPLSSENQEIIEAMHYVSGQNQPIEVW